MFACYHVALPGYGYACATNTDRKSVGSARQTLVQSLQENSECCEPLRRPSPVCKSRTPLQPAGVEAFEAVGLRVIGLKPQTIAPGQLDKRKFWVPNGSSDLGAVTTLDGQCRP